MHTRLKEAYQAAGRDWNARVEAARDAWVTETIATTTPPPGVDKRFMRDHLRRAAAPRWNQYTEAHYAFPAYEFPEQEELCRDVEMFIAHVARHEAALGLS